MLQRLRHRSFSLAWVARLVGIAALTTAITSCHGGSRTSDRAALPRRIEPTPALVDPLASDEARSLAVRLDTWRGAHVMIVGQQLPLWDTFGAGFWREALDDLGPAASDVRLVGIAAEEFADRPSADRAVIMDQLEAWVKTEGKILNVSFYPKNPASPMHDRVDWVSKAGTPWDRASKVDLQALVDQPDTASSQRFWRHFDASVKPTLIELARRKVPVIFRPLLEGNGNWFWWGCGGYAPAETEACLGGYNALYAEIQRRVGTFEVVIDGARTHVHDVLWEFSFAPWADDGSETRTTDAFALRPRHADGSIAYDIAGISTYDENPDAVSELPLIGLASLAKLATVSSRVALGEVGPQKLERRQWDPATVTRTLREWNRAAKTPLYPLWARFWSDDEWEDAKAHERPRYKQLSSFRSLDSRRSAVTWLATSDHGFFDLAPASIDVDAARREHTDGIRR